MRRVMVMTKVGPMPAVVLSEDGGDGQVYVRFDQGSQGSVPVERVQDLHEQDLRPQGLETK